MKKKILVFDTDVSGHHLEYLHHLLIKANSSNDDYIFYLPNSFNAVKGDDLDWSYNNNIVFSFFDPGDVNNIKSLYKASWVKCKLIKRALKKFEITHVFLITLIGFIPFLPFFISEKIKVSGIIYQIYLYRWKKSSLKQKILDLIKFYILRNSRCIDRIYILNDESSVKYLNKIYGTDKFYYLVDPYVNIDKDELISRDRLKISDSADVYLHLGDMRERKGTLDILQAISMCTREELQEKVFIFAGKVHINIRKEFYHLVNSLPKDCKIIIFDKFCEYSFFGALCDLSDYILIPYKQTGQSTGIIGYAAQFGRPVVGPNFGLIGKLIKRNKLGYTLAQVDAKFIYSFISNSSKDKLITQDYILKNTVENFINTLYFS